MSATQLAVLARTPEPRRMLRRFLALDAAVTGTNAVAYLAVSGPLGRFLGVRPGLLLVLGAFLAGYAVAVALTASRQEPPALAVRAVVATNLAWALLSFLALALWLTPSTAGTVWGVLQALTVAGLAGLQHAALKACRRN